MMYPRWTIAVGSVSYLVVLYFWITYVRCCGMAQAEARRSFPPSSRHMSFSGTLRPCRCEGVKMVVYIYGPQRGKSDMGHVAIPLTDEGAITIRRVGILHPWDIVLTCPLAPRTESYDTQLAYRRSFSGTNGGFRHFSSALSPSPTALFVPSPS